MASSSLALSNLRAFVIQIVLAFHSVLAYLGSLPASAVPFDSPLIGGLPFRLSTASVSFVAANKSESKRG